jgi:N-acetylglucosamine malate deacetylase 1
MTNLDHLSRLVDQWSSQFFAHSKNIRGIKRKIPKLKVVILSPHPDDECLLGSIAFRLKDENLAQVTNIAFSLGSKKERQKKRRVELKKAVKVLGIKNVVLKKENDLTSVLKKIKPQIVIASHLNDSHPTHIRSAKELLKALKVIHFSGTVVWGEYWGQIQKPNLLIEVSNHQIKKQVKALACHEGEISRNPYHLRLPGWMMDQVRRGSEAIQTMGASSINMPFGQIYQVAFFNKGKKSSKKFSSRFSTLHDDLTDILLNS